jgi:hypothetical protein
MEQQLIELLLVAKKALSAGQAMGGQANMLSQQSEHHADIIERTLPKLVFVRNHLLVQLTTLDRIREFLSTKAGDIRTIIKVSSRSEDGAFYITVLVSFDCLGTRSDVGQGVF